ncbi:MAG: T9SS type A sorting domain-containing protein [Taibaiella sp.]|nr:T9SS type A sorting domain-containing protein [Taibaiella sp.]
MNRNIYFLILVSLFAGVKGYAQLTCGTDRDYQQLRLQYPAIAALDAQLEKDIKNGMKDLELSRFARTTGADTTIYDIPIVVHILHDYGPENISDTVIYDAVNDWNIVYQKQNYDTSDVIAPFKKYVGNARCRFHLATIDPNGNPTKGITRLQTYYTNASNDRGKIGSWPHDKYVNIWFVSSFGGELTGAAAYARYPAIGGIMPYYDGVMSLYSYINYSKTIPHELGHVFNLIHVFGNTNSPAVACGDDSVDDTPPTLGHIPVGCTTAALYDTTCARNYFKIYHAVSGLDSVVDYPDTVNAQNIMDYTYCSRMFTIGQVQRMRLALQDTIGGRSNLHTAANLVLTGALDPYPDLRPVADFSVQKGVGSFTADKRSVFMCMNNIQLFNFRNESWNDTITGVQWMFSNSATTSTSSSLTSVTNRFSQPGWATVTLIATGNHSGNDTISKRAVYVADTTTIQPSGFLQTFNIAADTNKWPMFNYYNNQFKWEWFSGAGYDDNSSLRYHSYDNRTGYTSKTGWAMGDYDDIFTPAFDISANSTAQLKLNFYTAGAYDYRNDSVFIYPVFAQNLDSTANDSLEIFISTNCGANFSRIAILKNDDLLNNGRQNLEFLPTLPSQWVARTINIPPAYHTNQAFFRLRYWPMHNSNNLYLDKLQITPYTTEVNEIAIHPNVIKVYPNPTSGDCHVAFRAGADGHVSYSITDVTGKSFYNTDVTYSPHGLVDKVFAKQVFPAPGLYFITVRMTDNMSTQKIIIN